MLTPEQHWQLLTGKVVVDGAQHTLESINIGGVKSRYDLLNKLTPLLPKIPNKEGRRFLITVRLWNECSALASWDGSEPVDDVEVFVIEAEFRWSELKQMSFVSNLPEIEGMPIITEFETDIMEYDRFSINKYLPA